MQLLSLKETIARYELNARKSFGQHFLLDENITAKIARAAGDLTQGTVIEIGPGPGGLTRSLLKTGASVLAVEIDTRCIEALKELETAYPGKLTVLQADALKTDLLALTAAPRRIVANLPYNVGTPLLVKWLHEIYASPRAYASLTLMFQKEVAERITAAPDTSEYGRLGVLAQFLCEARPLFDLPPGAFSPPPKVTSTVIQLTPREKPLADIPLKNLERMLASAFGQRRKMLRQSLKSVGVDTENLLARAGIDGTRRAETLSVEEFCTLVASL